MFNFQGPWSLKSRYRIPEGPPVPIPNTEVKLRRAENTLPVTAREDRSAPTFWLSSSAQSEKARRGKGTVERRFFSGKKKEDKILRIFSNFIQALFYPRSRPLGVRSTPSGRERGFRIRDRSPKPSTPNGGVAQLGEHLPCKQGVMGSNPIISTRVDTAGRSTGL